MSGGRARAVLACALLLAAVGPVASAAAASNLEVGMEDERLLLSEPVQAQSAIAAMAAAGVDVVRIHARWIDVSPGRGAMRRPRGFDPGNQRSRRYRWETLDRAIDLTRAAGMRVMLSVTGPGPLWTSRSPRKHNPRYKPSPVLFGKFARAVATRYGDRVDRYLIWNEPNVAGWLEPQQTCSSRGCTPASPHLYRGLVRAARPAIERADPGAQVLLGELAPRGHTAISTRSPVSPLPFLRALGCVDRHYKRLRRGQCHHFRPASADAFGYHPHGVEFGPEDPNPDRDQAQIGDLPRLFSVLDRLTRAGRIGAPNRRFDVYLSEFGYQTSPPDHRVGISLGRQTRYLQQAAYLAWRLPRVRNLTQYQWRDEPVVARGGGPREFAGWQSGLRYVNDRPKPAFRGFTEPFVVDHAPGSARARFWGQIRSGAGARTVTLLRLRPGQGTFRVLTRVRTDARGFWARMLPVQRRAKYRYAWEQAAATAGGLPRRRLSGIVSLASDPARRWHASRP
jgi:hypothetical protein